MSRIGKLYKLVKVTRLLRLVKLMKKKDKMMTQLGNTFGEGIEKLLFAIVIFIMFSHFSACFWIFTAEFTEDDATNWVISGGYDEFSQM